MSTEKVKKNSNSKWSSERIKDFLINNALILIMLVLVVYVTATRPEFLKPTSLINLLSLTAAYLPVALGIAGCIVLTGTDLSAGRVVGITAVISASLLQAVTAPGKMWPNLEPPPIALVLLISVLIGALIGAFNGFWVAKFKLHPFIVTLATQLIIYTFILLYMQAGESTGQAISSLTKYREFVTGSIVGVPIGEVKQLQFLIMFGCFHISCSNVGDLE